MVDLARAEEVVKEFNNSMVKTESLYNKQMCRPELPLMS